MLEEGPLGESREEWVAAESCGREDGSHSGDGMGGTARQLTVGSCREAHQLLLPMSFQALEQRMHEPLSATEGQWGQLQPVQALAVRTLHLGAGGEEGGGSHLVDYGGERSTDLYVPVELPCPPQQLGM